MMTVRHLDEFPFMQKNHSTATSIFVLGVADTKYYLLLVRSVKRSITHSLNFGISAAHIDTNLTHWSDENDLMCRLQQ